MFGKQGQKWAPLELVIMSGELVSNSIVTAEFNSTSFAATVTWDDTKGAAADKAFVVVYDNKSKRIAYAAEVDRSAATVTIDASTFADVSDYNDIYAYLAFYRISEDGDGINSGTTALKAAKT
jgi:hypothetical protein